MFFIFSTFVVLLSAKNYWAKNIIFVIGDQDLHGLQAWINAYHQPPNYQDNPYLVHETMFTRFGLIYSAINLEIDTFTPKTLDVRIEGSNGLLPNLDLFNVAVELLSRENVPVTFHGASFNMVPSEMTNFVSNLITVKDMMGTQASNRMNGAHGLFQRYAIPAITLKTVPKIKSDEFSIVTPVSIGRAIEGTIRSINNLQERFHRSYYFYLLPNTRRYISIGYYMISFGLILLPLTIKSLQLYFSATSNIEKVRRAKILYYKLYDSQEEFSLWSCFQASFISHLIGMVGIFIPNVLSFWSIGNFGAMNGVDLTLSIFMAYFIISLMPTWVDIRKKESEHQLQAMVALLNIALFLGCLSLINISLAMILALVYVPCTLLLVSLQNFEFSLAENKRWLWKLYQLVLLALTHPLILYGLLLTVSHLRLDLQLYKRFDWHYMIRDVNLVNILDEMKHSLSSYIEEWYYFNSWTFPLVTLFWLPIWLQFYFMTISHVHN